MNEFFGVTIVSILLKLLDEGIRLGKQPLPSFAIVIYEKKAAPLLQEEWGFLY